jgi:DNA-binding NarL/FixJ family response regulator
MTEPRIAIVGGAGTLAAEALRWMLTEGGNRVVGTYPSTCEFVSATRAGEVDPQVAIVDADDQAGTAAVVGKIRGAHPAVKIVLLCEATSRAVVHCAIDEHVEGLVVKSDTAEQLRLAVRHVVEGRSVMPVGWHAALLEPAPDVRLAALTVREREVLDLVALGLSNREIADRLVISHDTVKFHLRTIYSRLGVHNRLQATRAVVPGAAIAAEP